MSGQAVYLAGVARVLPGHSVDYYLGGLPYAQGLQLQTIDLARQGVKFQDTGTDGGEFDRLAGW